MSRWGSIPRHFETMKPHIERIPRPRGLVLSLLSEGELFETPPLGDTRPDILNHWESVLIDSSARVSRGMQPLPQVIVKPRNP